MIRPLRMKKVKVIASLKYKTRLSKRLHIFGATHINDISSRVTDAEWKELTTNRISSKSEKMFLDYRTRLLNLDQIFRDFSIKDNDKAADNYRDSERDELVKDIEKTLYICEKQAVDSSGQMKELETKESALISQRDVLDVIEGIDVSLADIRESKAMECIILRVKRENFDEMKKRIRGIRKSFSEAAYAKEDAFMLVGFSRDKRDSLESALNGVDYEVVEIPDVSGKPRDEIDRIEKELKRIRSEKECLKKDVFSLSRRHGADVRRLANATDMFIDRYQMLSKCAGTDSAIIIEFFVRETDEKKAIEEVLIATDGRAIVFSVEPLSEELPSRVPAILSNPRIFKPFEGLVSMYSHPKYDDFDPTVLMAPGMLVFFGIMLNDFGYGLLLALAGVFIMKKYERLKMRSGDMGLMLVLLGLSSAVFGVVSGGYFGDALRRVVPSLPYAIDPLGESHMTFMGADAVNPIITVMLFALITGVVFIDIGFVLGIFDALFKLRGARKSGVKKAKLRKFEEQIVGHSGMLMFQAGLVFAVLHIYSGMFSFPMFWVLDLGMIIVSVVMLARAGGIQTLFGFFDMTGFLGDDLSFIRLLALCLATEGIANVVNMFVDFSFGMPYIGVVVGSLLFVFGHLFNAVVGALGAGVHSLRLQYVEFFSKFYEGGGIEFEAFGRKKNE